MRLSTIIPLSTSSLVALLLHTQFITTTQAHRGQNNRFDFGRARHLWGERHGDNVPGNAISPPFQGPPEVVGKEAVEQAGLEIVTEVVATATMTSIVAAATSLMASLGMDATAAMSSLGVDPAAASSVIANNAVVDPVTQITQPTTAGAAAPEVTGPGPAPQGVTDRAWMFRTRAQSAVNLGAWLVSERWLYPDLFKCTGIEDEEFGSESLLAQNNSCHAVDQEGDDKRTYLEKHWDSWITEADFAKLKELGVNTVRIPVGYWTLGPDYCNCRGSMFWPDDDRRYIDRYRNQWAYLMRAIDWAGQHDIGVLVDLHGAQGGQNPWEHSGETWVKDDPVLSHSNLFTSQANMDATKEVLKTILNSIQDYEHVVGLQLLNEPSPNLPGVVGAWYDQVIPELRQIAGPHFPLYLFGGFRDGAIQWKDWIDQRMELNSALYGFLVMDVHVYYLWNDKYKTMGMDGVLTDVANTYDYMGRLHKNVIVGEWSCALTGDSPADAEGIERKGQYCDAEMELFTAKLEGVQVAGWHYWNIKSQNDDSPWNFLQASQQREGNSRALVKPANSASNFDPNSASDAKFFTERSQIAKRNITRAHNVKRNAYRVEHGRGIEVWDEGCKVAKRFAKHGNKLGFTHEWINRDGLTHELYNGNQYHDHFVRGLRACES